MSSTQSNLVVRDVEYRRCAKKVNGAVNEIDLVNQELANIIDGIVENAIFDGPICRALISKKLQVSYIVGELVGHVENIEEDTKSFIDEIDEKDKYFY